MPYFIYVNRTYCEFCIKTNKNLIHDFNNCNTLYNTLSIFSGCDTFIKIGDCDNKCLVKKSEGY